MRTILNPDHGLHTGGHEFARGRTLATHESPERAAVIEAAVRAARLGPLSPAGDFGEAAISAVHDVGLVAFLKSAWADWQAAGLEGSALPFVFPVAGLGESQPLGSIHGQLGTWCFDTCTPIVAGTWQAAYGSAQTALTAAAGLYSPENPSGDRVIFALCRPPGHHAARRVYGGSCYLNNAAIATHALQQAGHGRVAILDLDYHHGNGTQEIFWPSAEVFYASLHGDPASTYPFLTGSAQERGGGAGLGTTLNLPLPQGCEAFEYGQALEQALNSIKGHGATALVLSLGVDTVAGDPIAGFSLGLADYRPLGQRLAQLALPTLVVLEGGYALSAIGSAVVETLIGLNM